MKCIHKNEEPQQIVDWKRKFKNMHGRNPQYADISKDAEHKKILKDSLILEQGSICCYCCKHIGSEDSHIEHFRPKGSVLYGTLSLEYDNLLASCCGYNDRNENCGHSKGNEFDENMLISPLEENCEQNFEFSSRGKIKAVGGNDRAKYTIGLLQLDTPALNSAREAAMWESGAMEDITEEQCLQLLDKFSSKDTYGQYAPFCDAIVYQLQKQLEHLKKLKKERDKE